MTNWEQNLLVFYGKKNKAKIVQSGNGLHEFDVLRDHDFSRETLTKCSGYCWRKQHEYRY